MSDAGDFIARLVAALDGAGVPYMVAGSFASTLHGAPRSTYDVDLVIAPSRSSLDALLHALPDDAYYVSREAANEALRDRGQFNVIDFASGWKADLIIRKARPFSVAEFSRRRPGRLLGVDVFVASPEDTVLAKLEWARLGGSDRQLEDVAGIVRVCGEELDRGHIERWLDELGVRDEWTRVLRDRLAQT